MTSADDMRALAHPVRLDLLELLVVHGPMTATDAAAALHQTPANVSWHLRKLAEYGFVRQAASGTGRRRPWKAIAESLSWGQDPDDAAPAAALDDVTLEREVQRLRAALAHNTAETQSWRDATAVLQARLWLTAAEAAEIGERLRELLLSKSEERHNPAHRPPDARVMSLVAWVVPQGPLETSAHAQPGDQ